MKKALNAFLWLVLGVALICAIAQGLFGLPWGVSVISGTSMEPTFIADDIVIVAPYFSALSSPQPGDIIVFEKEDGRSLVIHRVLEITDDGLITQGDNLAEPDQEMGVAPVVDSRIKGVVPTVSGSPITNSKVGVIYSMFTSEYRIWIMAGLALVITGVGIS